MLVLLIQLSQSIFICFWFLISFSFSFSFLFLLLSRRVLDRVSLTLGTWYLCIIFVWYHTKRDGGIEERRGGKSSDAKMICLECRECTDEDRTRVTFFLDQQK